VENGLRQQIIGRLYIIRNAPNTSEIEGREVHEVIYERIKRVAAYFRLILMLEETAP